MSSHRPLALHQITAKEAGPIGLVDIAADTGCEKVCIFTHVPTTALPNRKQIAVFPLVTQDNKRAMIERLQERNISVSNLEFFPITSGVDIGIYREGFALGAELGAERAVTHVHDTDDARALDSLARLADLAAEYRLSLGLEFMPLTPACATIQRAAWFVTQTGRPNIGIAVDALHLARGGGTPADVRALPSELFSYSQICDGHGLHMSSDYLPEALDRQLPGDGDFPLLELIEALPLHAALDVEVPSETRARAGVPALERARDAVNRTRALMARANVTR